jgi:hypothetical protein
MHERKKERKKEKFRNQQTVPELTPRFKTENENVCTLAFPRHFSNKLADETTKTLGLLRCSDSSTEHELRDETTTVTLKRCAVTASFQNYSEVTLGKRCI